MKSKYIERLRKISDAYNNLLDLNVWCFNKIMVDDTQLREEYQKEYHKYKSLSEYKKLLEECMEGL